MLVRTKSSQGAVLHGIDPVLSDIQQRLRTHPADWLQTLKDNPSSFLDLEKSVHHVFQQMADQLVAGLLAQVSQADDFAQAAKKK
jgi:hypothetical protein